MALPPVRPRDFSVAFFSASVPLTYAYSQAQNKLFPQYISTILQKKNAG